jgi:hypothetical protein
MKQILFAVLLIFSFYLQATPSPFHKHENDRFSTLEDVTGVTFPQTDPKETAGYSYQRIVKATYDASVDGGSENTDYALGITIPSGHIITEVSYRPTLTIVSASNNTIALKCEAANDLITAVDMTAFATTGASNYRYGQLTPSGTASVLTDGCELTLRVGSGSTGITAGKLDIFLKAFPTTLE